MRFAVCIPTYNRAAFILDALNSCPSEASFASLGHELDVLVFDNASEDDTLKVIATKRPDVQVFLNPKNLGYVGNVNRCLAVGQQYDWTIILHSDDLLVTDTILEIVKNIKILGECGIIFGHNQTMGSASRITANDFYSVWPAGDEGVERMQRPVACSGTFFRGGAIKSVGFYNDKYPFSADEEYNCRIAKKFPVICVNKVVSQYRRHTENTMLTTWKNPTFIDNFVKMRLSMNAMQSQPKSDSVVKSVIATTLARQIPYCLRQNEWRTSLEFAKYGVRHIRGNDMTVRVALCLIAGVAIGGSLSWIKGARNCRTTVSS